MLGHALARRLPVIQDALGLIVTGPGWCGNEDEGEWVIAFAAKLKTCADRNCHRDPWPHGELFFEILNRAPELAGAGQEVPDLFDGLMAHCFGDLPRPQRAVGETGNPATRGRQQPDLRAVRRDDVGFDGKGRRIERCRQYVILRIVGHGRCWLDYDLYARG